MKWLPEDNEKTLQEPCVTVTPEERAVPQRKCSKNYQKMCSK